MGANPAKSATERELRSLPRFATLSQLHLATGLEPDVWRKAVVLGRIRGYRASPRGRLRLELGEVRAFLASFGAGGARAPSTMH